MSKFTCPYCQKKYSKSKIPYVCPTCGEKTEPTFFIYSEPVKCKHFRRDPAGNLTNVPCGGTATIRRCPYCKREIPRDAIYTPNLPFSIIGVSNSGKTNYITVMLHELSAASGLRLALTPETNATRKRQNENFEHIYKEHMPPPATQTGTPMAQIWKISNISRRIGNRVPSYTFTIFDGAGEDHERLKHLDSRSLGSRSDIYHYIRNSKAIILAVDPLIIPNVRKRVEANIRRSSLGGSEGAEEDASEVMVGVIKYIRNATEGRSNNNNRTVQRMQSSVHDGFKSELNNKRKITIPTAVVFTKFDIVLDAFKDSFGNDATIRKTDLPVRNNSINVKEFTAINNEIMQWLVEDIEEGSFNKILSHNFKDYRYFGVSSYGESPQKNGMLPDEIKPMRVLDPILWLFKMANFVK